LRLRSVNIKDAATFAELAKISFADIRKARKWGESVALPGEDSSEVYLALDVGLLLPSSFTPNARSGPLSRRQPDGAHRFNQSHCA
jgi:hypothetical protein